VPDTSAAAAAPAAIRSSVGSIYCPQGHTCLLWTYADEDHACDLRDDSDLVAACQGYFEVGDEGYRCDVCDYDVCLQCYSALTAAAPALTGANPPAAAQTAPASPAAAGGTAARDAAGPGTPTVKYHDHFLGKVSVIPVAQLHQLDAPLTFVKAWLRFSRSRHAALGTAVPQPSPPVDHTQFALWPAQTLVFADGSEHFTANGWLCRYPPGKNQHGVVIRKSRAVSGEMAHNSGRSTLQGRIYGRTRSPPAAPACNPISPPPPCSPSHLTPAPLLPVPSHPRPPAPRPISPPHPFACQPTCLLPASCDAATLPCNFEAPSAPLPATLQHPNRQLKRRRIYRILALILCETWLLSSDNSSATCVATLGHGNCIFSVAFHPTARLLATGNGKVVNFWLLSSDNSSATCVATLGHGNCIFSVAFHPTARLLATGNGKVVNFWLLSSDNSSATDVATLAGQSFDVLSVAFHPSAPLLATGSWDSTAKLWH
jgi:hypothetical protein